MFILKNKFLFLLFLLVEILYVTTMHSRQQHITQDFLDLQTYTTVGGYQSVYNGFREVSEFAYSSVAANPAVTELLKEASKADEQRESAIRLEMSSLLQGDFLNIKKLQFEELQFYLPNSHSFLRMNEPELIGDDLSDVLESVAYVNTNHQPTEGFEIGKYASLFRFVYPLFDKDENYLGCVEFSVSPSTFIERLEKSLQSHLHFIINKEMLPVTNRDHYVKSFENENFLKLDDGTDSLDSFLDEAKREDIALNLRSGESFSQYLLENRNAITATFMPVKRINAKEPAAYFILYHENNELLVLGSDYWMRQGLGVLTILILFLLLSFQENRKKELRNSLEEKNSELETLNGHLGTLVQKQTQTIREESMFVREVLDALPIYIFWKDKESKYLGCNANFLKLAGAEFESEVIGKDDFAFPWHDEAALYRNTDKSILSTGKAQKNYISTVALPGDEKMLVSVSKVPLRDASGDIKGIIGAFYDIGELSLLQKEHEKLATVLNLSLNEVYIFNFNDTHAVFANCSAIHSLGYVRDEMQAISLSNLDAGNTEKFRNALQALREGRVEHQVIQGEHLRKDGTTYPAETHFQRMAIADSVQLVAISVDISERIAAEKEIEKINERYELTLAGVGDGIWDWDLVNNTIYFSKRWKEMLGFEEGEIENAFFEWENRVHPDDRQKAFDDFEANIAGKTEHYENLHRLKHKDGHWIWILDRGKTVFDEEGKALRMLGTHTDVTEKKALEEKIAKNEARLVEAQKIAHLGNWEWDLVTHKITWSDELYRLLGEEPQSYEPTYKKLLSYLPGEEKKRYKKNLRDMLNDMDVQKEYIWKIVRKDGSYRSVSSIIKVVYENGKKISLQGTFLDITERIEAEDTLSLMNSMLINSYEKQKIKANQISEVNDKLAKSHKEMMEAKAEAERASNSKSNFLANMSHEIRTPLNAMNGFISLLKADENDEQKRKYLEIIDHSSETLLQIINDILDCSKIESGKLEIEEINFQPVKELYRTAKLFQAKASEKEISLHISCREGMPDVLYGDVLRLKQVLSNLLSNAIKFTPNKGEIACIIRYEEGFLKFDVKDDGIGIDEDKLQHVFESFSQADNSIVREYGGTGLGLTISARLVEMLGGTLKVESKKGEGSIFSFAVPMNVGEGLVNEEKENIPTTDIQGHLLLVEDNEANRMFVGIILKSANVTYETANNGIEAIEKFKTGTFDLILMDENMPKLNGVGATKEILKIEQEKGLKHTPIIALTANALVGDRQLFIDAGMDDYLTKPFDPGQLLQKIGSIIGKK